MPVGGDKVTAQAQFEEGRRLVGEGKYAEACAKFADSERLDPSPSTVLNLANCWEKAGRMATAWATYKQAQSEAVAAKRPDYAATAERHAEALAPSLARLTILVPVPTEGLQLKRDGVSVDAAEWGTAIPIDAGAHVVEGSAPGYEKWSSTVDVPRDGVRVTVAIPTLEPLPPPAVAVAPTGAPSVTPVEATAPVPKEARAAGQPQRTVGAVVGGAGLVGLGASGVLALVANSKNQSSMNGCSGSVCWTQSAYQARGDARSAGDAATVVFLVGAAALATGVTLWLTAPRDVAGPPAALAWLAVTPAVGGATLQGAW